jgi:hypothetical protein
VNQLNFLGLIQFTKIFKILTAVHWEHQCELVSFLLFMVSEPNNQKSMITIRGIFFIQHLNLHSNIIIRVWRWDGVLKLNTQTLTLQHYECRLYYKLFLIVSTVKFPFILNFSYLFLNLPVGWTIPFKEKTKK